MDLELQKLYNTLLLVETKGESTIAMADCLRFTKQLIAQAKADREAKQAEQSGE
jgi:hypothetical protein